MTIVDEMRKKIKADGGDVKGVNTIVDGLKKMYAEEESNPSEPAESTPAEPAESTPSESNPSESNPSEG